MLRLCQIACQVSVALMLVGAPVHADTPQCIDKRMAVTRLQKELAEATAVREEWVKAHCKLVFNGRAPGRHWMCDGKFAGNEGTVLLSKDEVRIEGFLYNALARVDVCCGPTRPPNWCSFD